MKKPGRRPAAKKPKKSSLAAGGLSLSPEELALHNSFGEEFSVEGAQHRRLVAAVDKRRASLTPNPSPLPSSRAEGSPVHQQAPSG